MYVPGFNIWLTIFKKKKSLNCIFINQIFINLKQNLKYWFLLFCQSTFKLKTEHNIEKTKAFHIIYNTTGTKY